MRYIILILLTIAVFCNSFTQDTELDTNWVNAGEDYRMILRHAKGLEPTSNVVLTIYKNNEPSLIDSLFSSDCSIRFRDVNKDSFTDLLIFHKSGARSNSTYNLLIYDPELRKYKKVEGFNDWPNLLATEIEGVFVACILTGSVEYKFFRLTESGEFIDLNISVKDTIIDGQAYDRGMKLVKEPKR